MNFKFKPQTLSFCPGIAVLIGFDLCGEKQKRNRFDKTSSKSISYNFKQNSKGNTNKQGRNEEKKQVM